MPGSTDNSGKISEIETIKTASEGLYGTIAEELGQDTEHFEKDNIQLLKHHGTYQQDNRDSRKERRKAGLDKEYTMMVRTKFPGGIINAEQYLLCDKMADQYGRGDMRITSRQGFQFHGVVKKNLRGLIQDLNRLAEITTLGACGDVVRNTMAPPVADIAPEYADCGTDLLSLAKRISDHFLPATNSYIDLWLDNEKVKIESDGTVTFPDGNPRKETEEPLYGKTYLPRKFKIGIATDFDNSVDIFTQDVGILVKTDNGRTAGFEIIVGGGLGHHHTNPATFPRLGTPLTFVPSEEEIIPLLEAIIKVQRDYGDRADRKHARLKYLIEDWGLEKFAEKVAEYAGRKLPEPKNVKPSAQPDYLGWHKQSQQGLNYVGVWIENGRVKDFEESFQFRTGLREIIERFRPSVRMTPHHNVILANIADSDKDAVQQMLDQFGIPTDKGISPLRRLEMACPALPLCSLALSEAERVFPDVIKELEDAGHGTDEVMIRMTGCPNSCARPETAEIGIIGQAPNMYSIYTGGDRFGTRFNEKLAEKIKLPDLAATIAKLMDRWKEERKPEEFFGDWSHRVGVDSLRAVIQSEG